MGMDAKDITLFAALLAVIALLPAVAHAGLSSAQVIDIVGGKNGYLNPGEDAALLSNQPLDTGGEAYWVAYSFRTNSPGTRNALFAVSDNTGALETDAEQLKKVFATVAYYDAVKFLEDNKVAPNNLKIFLASQDELLRKARTDFNSIVKNQLEEKYSNEDFSSIEASLGALEDEQKATADAVNELFETRSLAFSYYAEADLKTYIEAYNETAKSFDKLAKAARKYRADLNAKVDEVVRDATLNFTDKENIAKGLEQLDKPFLSEYQSFSEATMRTTLDAAFEKLDNSQKTAGNEVDSTLYIIAKKNAERAYAADAKQRIETLLAKQMQSQLSSCGLDSTQLKTQWGEVRNAMDGSNATREEYLAMPAKVFSAITAAERLEKGLNDCTNPSGNDASTNKANDVTGIVVNILIIAAAALLLYIGYSKYKKMREESE